MTQETSIARVEAIGPTNMVELRALASAAAATGFYGARSPEQALLIAMTGRDLGLSYTQALRAFHVVQGRPVLSADGMIAAVLASGKARYFRTVERTPTRCVVETLRHGDEAPTSLTYTLEDAKSAKLLGKDNWQAHPAAMLAARAKAALARDVYPDVLLGMYDTDELEPVRSDVPAVPVAVPEPAVPASAVQPQRVDAQPLFVAIEAATCADELADVSTQIKAATPSLPDAVVRALRAAYGARKRELAAPPKAEPVVEEREPGSDG